MPVIAGTAATAADGEEIATIPSGSPMPSESPDDTQHFSHSDNTSSSNLTSNSTVSSKSEPTDVGENNATIVTVENISSSQVVKETELTDIVTQSNSQHKQFQLDAAASDEKLLQVDVGGAAVTQWSAGMSTAVSTSQLPSQYFKMSSHTLTSETDQTVTAPEQQNELSASSLSSLTTQSSQQLSNEESQVNIGMQPVNSTSVIPTITTTITNTHASLPSQIDASSRLRSTSLPSINLVTAIEGNTARAYRVGSLNNVMLRKQGDGLESNIPVLLTTPVTSQSLPTTDNQSASATVTTSSNMPMDDRPLLLDGENRSDGSDQAVGGARTDVSNVLEREGTLVGADSDEEENSITSSSPSETNFLTDDRPYSLLDHQLQFSLFEPSNLDAVMARDSLLSSLRPPVTAGQEKMAHANPSLSQAIQVTAVNSQSTDVFTTSSSTVTITEPLIVTSDVTIMPTVLNAAAAVTNQDVSVTRSDFLHGTSKLSEVERPTAVGFTEWDKLPMATVTTTQVPSNSEAGMVMASPSPLLNDLVRITSSDDILPYLEPQGVMDSDESGSVSATEPTMDFGSSMDGIELPQGPTDDFGEVKDTHSFLKELEQDELLVGQQNETPKVKIVCYCAIHS